MKALEVGDYGRALAALRRTADSKSVVGIAMAAFLLAMQEQYEEAEATLQGTPAPAISVIVRGEFDRYLRWHDPDVAKQLRTVHPLPELGFYAGMAEGLLMHNEELVARAQADIARAQRPQPGRLTMTDGRTRDFDDIRDADDAIGQMLEVYLGNGLLYAPFSWLRRVDFQPPRNFIDLLVPKVQLQGRDGSTVNGFCPLLYAGSSTSEESSVRTGRMTMFSYVGKGRRGLGQRDFVLDGGVMMGMQNFSAIEFSGPAPRVHLST